MTTEDRIIGTVYCTCTDHALSVETLNLTPNYEEFTVEFWTRGSQWEAPIPWRIRVWNALAWLRGRPQPADAVILDREGVRQLIDLLQEAYVQVREEPPDGE